jgi:hypothetical protein
MIRFFKTGVLICLLGVGFSSFIYAQTSGIAGVIIQKENGLSLEGATIRLVEEGVSSSSSVTGYFTLSSKIDGVVTLRVTKEGFVPSETSVSLRFGEVSKIEIALVQSSFSEIDDLSLLPTLSLENDDADFADGTGGQEISSILTASRDVFVSTASFVFSSARFRIRGYNPEYTNLSINGIPFNDAETGVAYFWQMGGLNDVLRARDINIGLAPVSYAFGELGGSSNIDLRPSRQWAQTRVSYAASNRSYRNRVMITHNTGMRKNGWAFSFSAARRWAQEGYIPGTFFDGYSYFLGAEKKINDKHSLSLVAFGAPTIRGGSSPAIQEMYDLAGTNYYNPNWGWQDGAKRNARVSNAHLPMAMLRHDYNINKKSVLTTSISYQAGRNGFGALNWDNAGDPRPDYYQKLPSFIADPELSSQLRNYLQENPDLLQIDWNNLYQVNYNNVRTVENADGIQGNSVTGRLAKYFMEERRIDNRVLNAVVLYENFISDKFTLNAGAHYRNFQGENYRLIQDLLGADFYINEDRFARIDFPNDPERWENDVDNPRKLLRKNDRFGYDYTVHIRQYNAWLQGVYKLRRWDFFASGRLSSSQYWREGNIRNGRFPENSFGASEKIDFLNYALKAGVTYKIDGRQYLFANGLQTTQAPLYRSVFISPRTRDEVNPHAKNENIQSVEGGYLFRNPVLKARLAGYFSRIRNQTTNISYFQDAGVDFDDDGEAEGGGNVNFVLYNVNKVYAGIEAAVEYAISPSLTLNAVAAVGDFYFANRPNALIILDNSSVPIAEDLLIYARNFYISRTPQQAYSLGLNYRSKKFWYANININYFAKNYLEFNPVRRTSQAVQDLEPGSEARSAILDQELLPNAMTVDLFGGKSWKIKKHFIYLNIGIGNLLNNTQFITGGYEQLRYDFAGQNPNRFPPRYFYAFGFNYFVNVAYRF